VCGYSPVHSLPRDTPRTGSLKCAHWKRIAERAKRSKFGVLPEDAPEALDATVQIVADDEETVWLRGVAFSGVRANALLAAIDRLVGYITRCPFSLSRLVKGAEAGQVVYKAEKDACRAFPEPNGDGLKQGAKRNFQVLDPLEFLAEFTQHIPPKGPHLIRYGGRGLGRGGRFRRRRPVRPRLGRRLVLPAA